MLKIIIGGKLTKFIIKLKIKLEAKPRIYKIKELIKEKFNLILKMMKKVINLVINLVYFRCFI